MKTWQFTTAVITVVLIMQAASAWADEIKAIKVRGNKRVEVDAVRVVIKSKPGQELSARQVAEDLKAIYSLGYFDEVSTELEEKPDGSVLVFVVKEKPAIAVVSFKGHDELSLDKIKEVVDIQILGVLDLAKIRNNISKIKELYVEKGFFLAEVDYELKELPRNHVKVTIVINERAKVEIKRIHFIGNQHVSSEELAANMETRVGDFFSWLTSSGTFKQEALKRDMLRIADYYYNHGYINVKVSEPVVEISSDRESLYVNISIDEGEQYRFGNYSFSGDLLVWDRALLKRIGDAKNDGAVRLILPTSLIRELQKQMDDREIAQLKLSVLEELEKEAKDRVAEGVWEEDRPQKPKDDSPRGKVRAQLVPQLKTQVLESLLMVEPGDMFDRSLLSKSMFRIQDVYKDRGYAYAEVIPMTNTDQEARIADINFEIQKGDKVYIERIDIKGNLKTRDKVIRRQLRVYEGELYSGTGKEISRRRVNMLGFFETVDVSEKRGSGPDRMVITFEVKERPTGTFQIGAGFSSVENFIATAQISQENLFGRGQTLSLMAQLSSMRQFFSVSFVEPYFLDTSWYFGFRVFNTQLDYITFLRQASGGDITLGYEFADFWRFALTYTLETVDVTSGGVGQGLRLENLFNDGWTSSVRLTLSWDTRDNRLFPSDGHFLQGSVEHASTYTLSENDFTRYTGIARYYFPIFWGFVLKSNVNLGYITSLSTEGIPIFEKYFVGGIYTIRGYKPRSIGPRLKTPANGYDPNSMLTTEPVGGNKQLITNLEIEFPIFPQVQIRGVVFMDAGNAYGEGEAFFSERYAEDPRDSRKLLKETFAGLYWSAGFGFRWFSPLGPLRFEWGIPLTRRSGDEDMLFEFTIGNFF